MEQYPSFEDIHKARETLRDLFLSHWLHDEMFSWRWWLNLILTLVPWFVWWQFVDKKRIFELLTFGFFIAIISGLLDAAGVNFVVWEYKVRLLPMVPPLFPMDITILPVSYMLIYQYCKRWKTYMLGLALMSAAFAFIFEPLLVMMKIYMLIKWKYWYSFPIYILLGIFSKWFVGRLKAATK